MAIVGYARVSSVGQSLEVQKGKLQLCDKIYLEKRSGTNRARPKLKECLEYVREGDILVITRLDRLGFFSLNPHLSLAPLTTPMETRLWA